MSDLTGQRWAVFGGVYNNYLALEATLADARAAGADRIICLGDVGGFGPFPDRSADLLRLDAGIDCLQGNYDDSVGNGLEDCQCGYSDPRDNHFARISYAYTLENTSEANREWMRTLPPQRRGQLGDRRVLCAHGSPRRVNEFLWESMTPVNFIRRLLDEFDTDLLFITHSGLPWARFLPEAPGRGIINVGAIGRPPNDGGSEVVYALVDAPTKAGAPPKLEFRRVGYDHIRLAEEMRGEGLPEEFVETILTGWWTTCTEILPARERMAGKY